MYDVTNKSWFTVYDYIINVKPNYTTAQIILYTYIDDYSE